MYTYTALTLEQMVQIWIIKNRIKEETIFNKIPIKYLYSESFLGIINGISSKQESQVTVKNSHISRLKSLFMTFPRIPTYDSEFYKKFETNLYI